MKKSTFILCFVLLAMMRQSTQAQNCPVTSPCDLLVTTPVANQPCLFAGGYTGVCGPSLGWRIENPLNGNVLMPQSNSPAFAYTAQKFGLYKFIHTTMENG